MARDPRKEGSRSKTRGKKGLPRRNAASGSAPKRARKSPAKGPKTTNLSKTTKVAKTAKVDRGAATALHRKLTEAQARQAATAEILKIIASSPSDVKPVFNAIVRTVLRVMRCDRAFIMRCAGGFYFLVARAARDGSFVELTSGSQPIDPEANFPSRAIVTGKTVYYSDRSLIDLPEHERLISEEFGVNSSLFLPLLRQDECIGVLALASKTTNAFNPSDIALAESFRDQALIAIENARLFHETNEALERQTATADILKVIASSPSNLPLVFDAIAHQANRLIGGYVTAVVLFKGDIAELAGFTPLNEMADARLRATFPRPIEDFALLELVRNGEAAQISDIETDARMPEQSRELARAAGFRSQLLTPLIGAPGPIGLIGVTRKEPGGFDAHHVQLLRTFADQAVIAIENARLFSETREALARQTATADVLKVIASSPSNLQPVFDAIAERSKALIGAHATTVTRYVDGILELTAFTRVSPEADAVLKNSYPRRPIEGGAVEQILRDGEIAQITDIEAGSHDPWMRANAQARGWRSLLQVPLRADSGVIGWISISRKEAGSFADKDVDLLRTFADQAVIAIQNVELFEEVQARTRDLQESLQQQTATSEVLEVISSSMGDVQPVFEKMLESAARVCGAQFGAMGLYTGEVYRRVAVYNVPPAFDVAAPREFSPAPEGPIGRALRTGQVLRIDDLRQSPTYLARNPATVAMVELAEARSLVIVPLLKDAKPIGQISIYRKEIRPFSDKEVNLLKNFANQAVIAIENARLFNETKEALERQTATSDVLKVIASSPSNLQPVFDAIAERSNELLHGHSTTVFRFIGDTIELAAFTSVTEEADAVLRAGFPRSRETLPGFEPAFHGEALETIDAQADTEAETSKNIARARGFRGRLIVPLKSDIGVIGAISITRKEPGRFADKDRELLQTFADQAVIAIQNVELFEEVQARTRDLQESLQQQTATADVLKVISRSAFDLDTVMNTLAQSALELCGSKTATLYLREEDTLVNRGRAPLERIDENLLKIPIPLNEESHVGRAVLTGTVANVADIVNSNTKLRKFQQVMGFRSLLAVPLMREGRGIGVFTLTRDEIGAFEQRQVDLVQSFADQAVIAIENTRLFNETRETLERQTATADILKVIATSPDDVQPVFQAIADRSNRLVNALSTTVFRLVDGMMYLRAFTPTSPEADAKLKATFPAPLSTFSWGESISKGEIYRVIDAEQEGQGLRDLANERGWRSCLCVPLIRDGKPIGMIGPTRAEPGPFTDHHVQLMQTFADQAVIAIQNVELFEEVQRRTRDLQESLQQQTATSEVLKVISRSAFDLQTVLNTLVESAARLCEADECIIVQPKEEGYGLSADWGLPEAKKEFLSSVTFRPDDGRLTGTVLKTGKVIHIHDVLAEPGFVVTGDPEPARTRLGVPLLRDGNPVGIFVLTRLHVRPFTERQIELVQTYAAQAVIAIENARLFNETKEALERQTATADILKVIASSPDDVQPVFQAIADQSKRLLNALATATYSFVDDEAHLMSFTPVNPDADAHLKASFPYPLANIIWSDAIRNGEIFRVIDTEDGTVPVRLRDMARTRRWRSAVFVPLLSDRRVIGAISITRADPGSFADHHVEILKTFADQAVIAISNVELLQQVQNRTKELQESLEQQTATADILAAISASMNDTKPVFDAIAKSLRRLFDAPFAMVQTLNNDIVEIAAADGEVGVEQRLRQRYPRALSGESVGGIAMQEKRTVQFHPLVGNPAVPLLTQQNAREFGYNSLLFNPMFSGDTVVGAIGVGRREAVPFDDKQIALIASFANQAVIAIENTRLLRELRERTDALARSLDDLRAAQDRLVQTEKLASLGQLTAGIAHEIKNPLNFVNNFSALSVELTDELNDVLKQAKVAEMVQQEVGELTQLLRSNLEKVVQHGKRADSIVRNMLLHSREGSGERRSVDINALVEESLNLAYHGARAERSDFQITLERDLDPDAGQVELYPQEITRALLNMISNGFYAAMRRAREADYGFEPTLLAVTRGLADRVEIRIRDNGTGIPSEVKEKMFNPFFTTKPAGEGTGLGLSMSHDIVVKQHGGTIEVETEAGRFTEFIIALPRAKHLRQA